MQILYTAGAVELYAGYATERFDDPVPASTLGDSDAAYAGVVHTLGKGVSYGLELTRFSGDYEGMKKATANQAKVTSVDALDAFDPESAVAALVGPASPKLDH